MEATSIHGRLILDKVEPGIFTADARAAKVDMKEQKIQTGDIVMIVSSTLPHESWLLGASWKSCQTEKTYQDNKNQDKNQHFGA
ncbi:hypothetical protein LDENG_00017310 [Lucifuga dentata]|nr:hypothetical protein LDENG_00017310 [Lucifuga dentata]